MTGRTQTYRIRTPEGVSFSFRIASPVLRMTALLIDVAVISVAWMLLSILIGFLGLLSFDLMGMLYYLGYFVVSEGYRILAEWLWRGQTVGKRVMRLRVVDEAGFHLTFAQVAMRNILRFVDALPLAYFIGGLCALLTKNGQRLGDLAAGTLVIWEVHEPVPDFDQLRSEKYNSLRGHAPVVARLRQLITPNEARTAWQAILRRDQLEESARLSLFADLAAHFRAITPIPQDATDGVSDEQFVRNVVDVLYRERD